MNRIICLYRDVAEYMMEEPDESFRMSIEWHHIDSFPRDGQLYVCPFFFVPELKRLHPGAMIIAWGDLTAMRLIFEVGVDDYMLSPWTMSELFIRAKRHVGTPEYFFSWGKITCDGQKSEFEGIPLGLNCTEHALLAILAQNPGKIMSKKSLVNCLGMKSTHLSRTIDMYMCNIRQALTIPNQRAGMPVIRNVYGKGYFLLG